MIFDSKSNNLDQRKIAKDETEFKSLETKRQ